MVLDESRDQAPVLYLIWCLAQQGINVMRPKSPRLKCVFPGPRAHDSHHGDWRLGSPRTLRMDGRTPVDVLELEEESLFVISHAKQSRQA